MGKYFAPLKRQLIFFLVLSSVVAIAGGYAVSRVWFELVIAREVKLLERDYRMTLQQADTVWRAIDSMQPLTCSAAQRQQLQQLAFNASNISMVSIKSVQDQNCSSHSLLQEYRHQHTGSQLIYSKESKELYRDIGEEREGFDFNLGIATDNTHASAGVEEMVLERDFGGAQVQLHIEDSTINQLGSRYCSSCIYLQVGLPDYDLEFAVGNPDVVIQDAAHKSGRVEQNNVSFTLYFGDRLKLFFLNLSVIPVLGLTLVGVLALSILVLSFRYLTQRGGLTALIDKGLSNDEFVPFYQPIVDSDKNKLYGCEVLLRWRKDGDGMVMPVDFIPAVEGSGQIIEITEQILAQVFADLEQMNWQLDSGQVSINIVAQHLQTDRLWRKLMELCGQHGISPHNISLELTEREKITDMSAAAKNIDLFLSSGVSLKLDDAGTGYGGFSYIQQLGFGCLKIDKMFIDTIGTEDVKRPVLDSIVEFGRKANLLLIAEGVETSLQAEQLLLLGVTLQQGYYHSAPLDCEAFARFVEALKLDGCETVPLLRAVS